MTRPAKTYYEYGVARDSHPHEMHRGPMEEAEAREWVQEWDSMSENESARKGMFVVIKRPVGPWDVA
jgi:hypothetical protein